MLGLQRDASVEAVRSALRAARLATHPDRNGGSDAAEAAATEAAKWVAKAAEVLGHPGKRRTYAHANHNLAAYEEAVAVAEERETRKRQREEDAKAEQQKRDAAEAAARAAKRQREEERQAARKAARETVTAAAQGSVEVSEEELQAARKQGRERTTGGQRSRQQAAHARQARKKARAASGNPDQH